MMDDLLLTIANERVNDLNDRITHNQFMFAVKQPSRFRLLRVALMTASVLVALWLIA